MKKEYIYIYIDIYKKNMKTSHDCMHRGGMWKEIQQFFSY